MKCFSKTLCVLRQMPTLVNHTRLRKFAVIESMFFNTGFSVRSFTSTACYDVLWVPYLGSVVLFQDVHTARENNNISDNKALTKSGLICHHLLGEQILHKKSDYCAFIA